jgi:GntR family transcriptional repressor for pyruvate dehydrogenase complex
LDTGGVEKIKRSTLTEGVISRIKIMIENHDFVAGEKLPTERELAEMFGVGRSSVREALQALQMVGALERRQGKGTFLGDAAVQSLQKMGASVEKYNFMELAEARRIIEVQAAALSAKNANSEDIEVMRAAYSKHAENLRARLRPEITALDYDFHRAVVRGAHNSFLLKMFDILRDNLIVSNYAVLTKNKITDAIAYHRRILASILSRDQNRAMERMEKHLLQVERLIIKSYQNHENSEGEIK